MGLRIYNDSTQNVNPNGTPIFVHHSLKQDCSDFSAYFGELIGKQNYRWVFANEPDFWIGPSEWLDDSDFMPSLQKGTRMHDLFNSHIIFRKPEDGLHKQGIEYEGKIIRDYYYVGVFESKIMNKYADIVRDDWSESLTLADDIADFEEIIEYFQGNKEFTAQQAQELIERNAQQYFYNFDGAFWQFFSRNHEEVAQLSEYLRRYPSVKVIEEEFDIRKIKMEYWDKT